MAIKVLFALDVLWRPDWLAHQDRAPATEDYRVALLVQDYRQQRLVDFDFAVIFDEAQFSEFVHEEIHTRTRGSDHLC
jgi:hypothetical protein